MAPATRPDGTVFWSDGRPRRARPAPPPAQVDVLVVGAGYTGLWSALEILRRQPGLTVCVVDAQRVGDGASGRNGGWLEPSLTHGIHNGERRFDTEMAELERIARTALDDIATFIDAENIQCGLELTGTLECAVADHQLKDLDALAESYTRYGWPVERLDRSEVRDYLHSPRPVGAVRASTRGGLLDPYALVQGLAAAVERAGATVHEGQRVTHIARRRHGVVATTSAGHLVLAASAVLAIDADVRHLRRRTGLLTVPLNDYVMVSEPLGPARRASLGWARREGVADLSGAFTSMRLTADDRLYWGGSEAVYRWGSRHDSGRQTHRWDRLGRDAATWFPQLARLSWTHRWTGIVPMTASAIPAFGSMLGGRAHYVFGYTGLGVLSSHVAATVLAARALGQPSRLGELAWSNRGAVPFPPEPVRWASVELARRSLTRADRDGHQNLYLRLLDRLGIGLTS